jgi:hypothetical protein
MRYDWHKSGWKRTVEGEGYRKAMGASRIEKGEVPENLPFFRRKESCWETVVSLWSFYCRLIVPAFSQQFSLRNRYCISYASNAIICNVFELNDILR